MKINKQTDFTYTLNLVKPTIPLDAKLTKKQGYLLESVQDPKKYKIAEEKNKNASNVYNISRLPMQVYDKLTPKDIVNSIYKDVLIRYECMQGNLVNHSIGFIYENTLEDEKSISGEDKNKKAIAYQKELYDTIYDRIYRVKTLGTAIDYSKQNYSTISNEFANLVIDKFYEMYNNGRIYLEKKPLQHCLKCGKDFDRKHVDYVRKKHINFYAMYRVKEDFGAISKFSNLRNTYVIATTISPWIIGASNTLAITKDSTYALVQVEQVDATHHYIIEKEKVAQVMQTAFFMKYEIKDEITSEQLSKFELVNPMDYTSVSKVVQTDKELIDLDSKNSTGIRIILPEYSYADYLVYKRNNIEIPSMAVDDNGIIIKGNARVKGKSIFEANDFVVNFIKKGELSFLIDYIPVVVCRCKNCNEELIYTQKPGFYIKSDEVQANLVKENAKTLIQKAGVVKEFDRKKMLDKIDSISSSEDIKIFDNSTLGIPVPAYYCRDCNELVLNDTTVNTTKDYISSKGITLISVAEDLFKNKNACPKCSSSNLVSARLVFNSFFKKLCIPMLDEKEVNEKYANKNVIDVLIESKKDFLDRLKILTYNEHGSDLLQNVEKYIIHSDVSENTKIIAKPIFFDKTNTEDMKNAIVTEIGMTDVFKKYGTDILRLWGVLAARNRNIVLSEQAIIKSNTIYKGLRKTIKYLLSNLQDFNPTTDYIDVSERTDLDKYIYKKLYDFSQIVKQEYEACYFDEACKHICDFCRKVLCRDYFSVIKYRLYILDTNSKTRLMTLSTMFDVFMQLVMYLEPILPFTLEEAWQYAWHNSKEEEKNILMHRENITLSQIQDGDFESKWDKIFKFVRDINKLLRKDIASKKFKNTQEVCLKLYVLEEKVAFLEENKKDLEKSLNVSKIEIITVENKEERKIVTEKAEGRICSRCKNYTTDVGRDVKYLNLCLDCVDILENKK